MNLPLLPQKHARLNETILGIGAITLNELTTPQTVDEVWDKLKTLKSKKMLPDRVSFEDLVLTLDFLYALRTITLNEEGALSRCA
jgi:hypothetical protein